MSALLPIISSKNLCWKTFRQLHFYICKKETDTLSQKLLLLWIWKKNHQKQPNKEQKEIFPHLLKAHSLIALPKKPNKVSLPKPKPSNRVWNIFGYRPVLNGLWLLSKEYIPSYHRCVTAACEETLVRLYVVTENGAMDPFCFLVGLRAKPCRLLYLYVNSFFNSVDAFSWNLVYLPYKGEHWSHLHVSSWGTFFRVNNIQNPCL